MHGTRILYHYVLLIIVGAILIEASIIQIGYMSSYSRLQQDYRHMDGFRCQYIDEAMLQLLKQKSTREDPGEYLGLYWMETNHIFI